MWWTACHIGFLNKLRFLQLLIFPCVLVTLLLILTINSVVSSSLTCHPLLILAHTHSYSRFWVTHHRSASVGSQRCGHGSWRQTSRGEIFSLFLLTFFRTFWDALTLLRGENGNADRFRALRPRRTTTRATDRCNALRASVPSSISTEASSPNSQRMSCPLAWFRWLLPFCRTSLIKLVRRQFLIFYHQFMCFPLRRFVFPWPSCTDWMTTTRGR